MPLNSASQSDDGQISRSFRYRSLAGLFFAIAALLGVAGSLYVAYAPQIAFDEATWRKQVLAQDRKLLYAPNYRDGAGFFNPWMPDRPRHGSILQFHASARIKNPPDMDESKYAAVPNDYAYLADAGNTLGFAGHASFIIRMDGSTILTDPYFSGRALIIRDSVTRSVNFSSIPLHPVVLISHNHYDHLDSWSVSRLVERQAVFIVPLGLKGFITSLGATQVHELDWWQDVTINKIRYTLLPAQHWSRRLWQSHNSTLWGSFMIEGSSKIFFSGDTGYFIGFKEFGDRFPGIDYALIGVGAYEPRWFMHYAHLNVEEFFLAADDLKARVAIPMHFGIIRLGREPLLYPLYEMDNYVKKHPEWQEKLKVLRVGQYMEIP